MDKLSERDRMELEEAVGLLKDCGAREVDLVDLDEADPFIEHIEAKKEFVRVA